MSAKSLSALPMFTPPAPSRSRNMAAIKAGNTKPELLVRKALHAAGFRFRLHSKTISGTPDLVLPRYCIAVFVHGCFWHGHGCKKDHEPRTNRPYWSAKIERNVARDRRVKESIEAAGWHVVVIWECQAREGTDQLISDLTLERVIAAHGAK